MRWHPEIIRRCLYLHHCSSGCYNTLRNTGVLSLPSERTLRDYKHFAPASVGFSYSTDLQLLDKIKQQKPPHLSKYVGIVIDEMYVKEGLVYDNSTGCLTGYADLGEVNNLLLAAEQKFKDPSSNVQRSLFFEHKWATYNTTWPQLSFSCNFRFTYPELFFDCCCKV